MVLLPSLMYQHCMGRVGESYRGVEEHTETEL
jgi:hypothetical protein